MTTPARVCRICNESKPIELFSRNSSYADNLDIRCRACNSNRINTYLKAKRAAHKGRLARRRAAYAAKAA